MSDAIHAANPGGPAPLGPTQGVRGSERAREGATARTGLRPAFDALLHDLERKARELSEASATVAEPAGLAQAVARAGDSLQAALSVQERILEAFRASVAQAKPAGGPPGVAAPESAAGDGGRGTERAG